MAQTYNISELAREFEVTTRTIRFYEEKGLLSPERDGQRRLYSAADRTALKLVLRGKRIGLSLDESKELIGMYKPGGDNLGQLLQLRQKISERRDALKAQLIDINAMLSELSSVESRCEEAIEQLQTANH